MPISHLLGLSRLAKPLTSEEGHRILERDRYRCQYCGLDGTSNFDASLIMTVDFVQPRAKKGKKAPANLVTACRPCNMLKGYRTFASFDEAKAYVLKRRMELQKQWEAKTAPLRSQAAAGAAQAH
jgi:5-methylcytosine-specific restriction endonuclease McrA